MHRYMTRSRRRVDRAVLALQRRFRSIKLHVDPITRDNVVFPAFTHVTPSGHETVYSARILARYIQVSGNALDPSTRIRFSGVELERLSRVSGIQVRDEAKLEEVRQHRNETESLQAWLLNDIEDNISSLRSFDTMSTRRMLSTVFPSLIVNVVRYIRNCEEEHYDETVETLFSSIDSMVNVLESDHVENVSFRTMIMIFKQFLSDLRVHVVNRTLLSGSAANINIGGMRISMDLREI